MKKLIADCTTGEVYERDFTQEELEQHKKDEARLAAEKVATQAKIEAKAALLERLGITEAEAKLLLA